MAVDELPAAADVTVGNFELPVAVHAGAIATAAATMNTTGEPGRDIGVSMPSWRG